MSTGHVWTCIAWDSGTSACTTEGWVESPSVLPTLSSADAQAIGFSIAMVWALAFCIRQFKKMLDL